MVESHRCPDLVVHDGCASGRGRRRVLQRLTAVCHDEVGVEARQRPPKVQGDSWVEPQAPAEARRPVQRYVGRQWALTRPEQGDDAMAVRITVQLVAQPADVRLGTAGQVAREHVRDSHRAHAVTLASASGVLQDAAVVCLIATVATEPADAGPLPTFLIIGAMRSGTTALHHYLRDHPAVFMATPKEVHFFDRHYELGLAWYRQHFSAGVGRDAIGEATQTYMYDGDALHRLAATLPGVQLIAVLRNPVDRAYSHYWFNRARDLEALSFEAAVEQEDERRAASPTERERRRVSYVDRGRYLPQLEEVVARCGRDKVLVVLFEDLRDQPGPTYAEVCRFLGVDDAYQPPTLGQPANSYVGFRSAAAQRIIKRMPPGLPRRVAGRLNSRAEPVPPMAPAVRQGLIERFREDNSQLSAWLGRDLPGWDR